MAIDADYGCTRIRWEEWQAGCFALINEFIPRFENTTSFEEWMQAGPYMDRWKRNLRCLRRKEPEVIIVQRMGIQEAQHTIVSVLRFLSCGSVDIAGCDLSNAVEMFSMTQHIDS